MRAAITLRSFMRSDRRQHVSSGEYIEGAADYINELAKLGLARLVAMDPERRETKDGPFPDAGEKSSVSPAAPALPPETAPRRKPGRPPKPPAA